MSCQSVLNSLRKDNLSKQVFVGLNINSIRNKFDCFSEKVSENIDILLVLEAKIDYIFQLIKSLDMVLVLLIGRS